MLQSFAYIILDTWWVKEYTHKSVINIDARNADIQDTRKSHNNLLDRAKVVVSSLIAYDKENVPVQQFGIGVTPILGRRPIVDILNDQHRDDQSIFAMINAGT